MLTCLFGKPEAVEAIALGENGRDTTMSRHCVKWAPLPEPLALEAGEEIYRVSRHLLNGQVWTWIGLYRAAQAIGSDRPGGFYGAAVLSRSEEVDGAETIAYLKEIADQVRATAMSGSGFVKKLSGINFTIDPAWVKQLLEPEALPANVGLRESAEQEAFIELSGQPGQPALGELLSLAQYDERFSRESAVYFSRFSRLAEIAAQAKRTTKIKLVDDAHGYLGRGRPVAEPEPMPPPHISGYPAPASRTVTAEPDGAPQSWRNIQDIVRQELANQMPEMLGKQLDEQLRRRLPRIRRRRWLEQGAPAALLFAAFLAAVLLGLTLIDRFAPSARSAAPDTPSVTGSGGTVGSGTTFSTAPGTAEADVRAAIEGYANGLATKQFAEALRYWQEGRFSLDTAALAANFQARFQDYTISNIAAVTIVGDRASAEVTVTATLANGRQIRAQVPVELTHASDGWRITRMAFGESRAADPEQ